MSTFIECLDCANFLRYACTVHTYTYRGTHIYVYVDIHRHTYVNSVCVIHLIIAIQPI